MALKHRRQKKEPATTTSEKEHTTSHSLLLGALGVVCIIFAVCVLQIYDRGGAFKECTSITRDDHYTIGGYKYKQVQRIACQKNAINATELFENNVPIVVVGTEALEWPAAQWSPKSLAERFLSLKDIVSVEQSTDNTTVADSLMGSKSYFIHWDKEKPILRDAGKEDLQQPHKTVQVTASSFLKAMVADDVGNSHNVTYFSANLNSRSHTSSFLEALRKDIGSISSLLYSNTRKQNEEKVFLWAGTKGATACMHFDTSHNAYHQIYGQKRFVLKPPTDIPSLQFFPVVHPSDRQLHIPWVPDGSDDNTMIVDLSPGETLFLPAHWLHQVIALTSSISVNVWSLSNAGHIMEDIMSNPLQGLGYKHDWPTDKLLLVLQHFLPALIKIALQHTTDSKTFILNLLEHKYTAQTSNHDFNTGILGWMDYKSEEQSTPFPCSVSRGRGLDEYVKGPALTTGKRFHEIEPIELAVVYLEVFVEVLSEFAVGSRDTARFLRDCL
eukprot:m.90993 g.90993  ORF g.90993 m.90993 type:complete len:498 (-) comp13285_c0_seq2:913-2406(-)